MAKISANNSYHSKLIKLRRYLDAYNEELIALETKYDEKIESKLNSFIRKGNKKLGEVAFEACNKEEYAQSSLDEKLQKYDVKAYMKQRAINYKASKKIFKLVKAGKAFGYVLANRNKKMAKLDEKRNKYILSLKRKKDRFLKNNFT